MELEHVDHSVCARGVGRDRRVRLAQRVGSVQGPGPGRGQRCQRQQPTFCCFANPGDGVSAAEKALPALPTDAYSGRGAAPALAAAPMISSEISPGGQGRKEEELPRARSPHPRPLTWLCDAIPGLWWVGGVAVSHVRTSGRIVNPFARLSFWIGWCTGREEVESKRPLPPLYCTRTHVSHLGVPGGQVESVRGMCVIAMHAVEWRFQALSRF